MLVHAPIACWMMTPLCDVLAISLGGTFFWQSAAFIAAIGVAAGALAATVGAMELSRAQANAAKLALVHAGLMSSAWLLSTVGLIGRINESYSAVAPAPWWAIGAGAGAFVIMLVGAWCGGEMVYGRGVGVRERASNRTAQPHGG